MTSVVLTRTAGLAPRALAALADPSTVAAIHAVLAAEADLPISADLVSDALYEAIPQLPAHLRGSALAVRRSTRPGRAVKVPTAELLDALAPETRSAVERWSVVAQSLPALRAAVEAQLAAGAARALVRGAGELRSGEVLRGIAFASPQFCARLLSSRPVTAEGTTSRFARSLVHYLSRTALKPSPFSTLATVGVAGFAAGDSVGMHATGRSLLQRTAFRSLPMALWLACLSQPEAWAQVMSRQVMSGQPHPVRPIDTATVQGRAYALIPSYSVARGLYYRHDDLVELSDPNEVAGPPGAPRSVDDWARAVATGTVHPVTPWGLSSGGHLDRLVDVFERRDDRPGAGLADPVIKQLSAAAVAERQALTATDPVRVIAAQADLRAAATEVFAELREPVPAWLASAPLVHETVATAVATPAIDPGRLAPLAALLTDRLSVTPFYRLLVDGFVRRHGIGGRCGVLDFCADVLVAMENGIVSPPTESEPVRDLPRGHLSLARPASAVFYQEAGERLVINKLVPGYLGTVARWAGVPALAGRIETAFRELAAHRHPGCRTYQYTASADWTTLQRPVSTMTLVTWGADRAASDAGVPLSRFSLRHDNASGTLQFEDPDGSPAALEYTGTIPPYLVGGVAGVLAVLSDPWTVALPGVARPSRRGDGMVANPRISLGGLVVRRASWFVASDQLPMAGGTAAESLVEAERWRRAKGLPEEFFVTTHRSTADDAHAPKPAWVSFDHPLTVLAALAELNGHSDATGWTITEALPAAGHRRPDRPVTEYLSFLDHGPAADPSPAKSFSLLTDWTPA